MDRREIVNFTLDEVVHYKKMFCRFRGTVVKVKRIGSLLVFEKLDNENWKNLRTK